MNCDETFNAGIHYVTDAYKRVCKFNEELHADLEECRAENDKLRDVLKALMMGTNVELRAYRDEPGCKECFMHHGKDGCAMVDAMELLCIDMFGEPLGVES